MNFIGIGSFEFLLIIAVALFVVGPRRLVRGIQDFKRHYSDFKRRRDEFTSMLSESVEADMIRREVVEPVTDGAREIKTALTLDPDEIAPGLDELRETLESDPLNPRRKPPARGAARRK